MRILIAAPFANPNSGEILGVYAQGLQSAFTRTGHSAQVVARNGLDKTLPAPLRHISYFFRLLSNVWKSDIVLALDTWSTGFPALLAAIILRKKFAVRIGGDFLWESFVERVKEPVLLSEFYKVVRPLSLKERMISSGMRFLTKHADALLFTTRFQETIWRNAYDFSQVRSHIVENYFPPKQNAPGSRSRVFVSSGRRMFLKNTGMLQDVFKNIVARHPDVSLDTSSLSRDLHLERLQRAYTVIIPTFSEVCSNTAIEAVSNGVPFIMSRDTGSLERLSECGLFIDTRDEREMTHAIESLLEPEMRERLEKAISAFSYEHSWDDMAREIGKIFHSI